MKDMSKNHPKEDDIVFDRGSNQLFVNLIRV